MVQVNIQCTVLFFVLEKQAKGKSGPAEQQARRYRHYSDARAGNPFETDRNVERRSAGYTERYYPGAVRCPYERSSRGVGEEGIAVYNCAVGAVSYDQLASRLLKLDMDLLPLYQALGGKLDLGCKAGQQPA